MTRLELQVHPCLLDRCRRRRRLAGMTDKSPFNRWFAGLLRRKGMTHMDAAWELGVHLSTVSKWAGGFRATPSYEQLVRIVATFGELPPELDAALYSREPGPGTDDTAHRTPDNGGNGPAEAPPPKAEHHAGNPIGPVEARPRPDRRASA